MNAFSNGVADRTVHRGAARQVAEAPARAKPEAPARVKPGISGKTASSAPHPAPAAAKPLPNLSPGELAHAAKIGLLQLQQANLAGLDTLDMPPELREQKEVEFHALWQSTLATATTSRNIQMSLLTLAATDLHRAENDIEKEIAEKGSPPKKTRDRLSDAGSAFTSARLNAEEAVSVLKQVEGTRQGDANAARDNFTIADYQLAAAERALKDAKGERNPEETRINTAQWEVHVAAMRYLVAANEELEASNAWLAEAQRGGDGEEIEKSMAWVGAGTANDVASAQQAWARLHPTSLGDKP